MVKSRKINVGITIGDPNGIGIEIILKSLANFSLFHECNFILYASTGLIEKQKQHFPDNIRKASKTKKKKEKKSSTAAANVQCLEVRICK